MKPHKTRAHKSTRWTLPPTARQIHALVLLGVQDNEMPDTRWQARDIIYRLRNQRKGGQTNGLDRGRQAGNG